MVKFLEKLFNPAMGIFPLLVFMALQSFVPYDTALLTGVIVYISFMLVKIPSFKLSPPFMLLMTGIVFCIYLILTRFTLLKNIDSLYSPIIIEVIFLIAFGLITFFRQYIKRGIVKKDKSVGDVIKFTRLNEYFLVAKLYKNVIICHLLIVVLYQIFPPEYKSPALDKFIFAQINIILILFVIIYEYIRLRVLNKKINMENWLPVVNEAGKVIGKVAFSVSQTSRRSFLHPVVRITLIYKGLLYLVERPSHYILDPNKIDYPFEQYVKFHENLDETIKSMLLKKAGISDLPVKFVFRYLFKNNISNRLIYLFTLNIQDEKILNSLNLAGGKLWTEKQIEENLGTGLFSECFEKEYEVLKNTVLMAEKLINNPANISASN